ncbi:MAG: glycosyltransferase family 9 protein, partial [Candidatus Hydrogenedentales bacterium]
MRILVVQMTRLGDVVQTTPLLGALRRCYRDAQITLLIRPMGKAAAERIPGVDEVLVYDEDRIFAGLRVCDSERLAAAFREADAFVRGLRDRRFDVAYNCTHSIASAMLLRLANVPRVVGAHMSEDWQFLVRGRWPNYFFTSALHRAYNDLNLCDLSGRFEEDAAPSRALAFTVTAEDRDEASALLAEHRIAGEQRPIAVQLGASDSMKRWPVEKFAAAVQRLAAETGAPVVLLGVEG